MSFKGMPTGEDQVRPKLAPGASVHDYRGPRNYACRADVTSGIDKAMATEAFRALEACLGVGQRSASAAVPTPEAGRCDWSAWEEDARLVKEWIWGVAGSPDVAKRAEGIRAACRTLAAYQKALAMDDPAAMGKKQEYLGFCMTLARWAKDDAAAAEAYLLLAAYHFAQKDARASDSALKYVDAVLSRGPVQSLPGRVEEMVRRYLDGDAGMKFPEAYAERVSQRMAPEAALDLAKAHARHEEPQIARCVALRVSEIAKGSETRAPALTLTALAAIRRARSVAASVPPPYFQNWDKDKADEQAQAVSRFKSSQALAVEHLREASRLLNQAAGVLTPPERAKNAQDLAACIDGELQLFRPPARRSF